MGFLWRTIVDFVGELVSNFGFSACSIRNQRTSSNAHVPCKPCGRSTGEGEFAKFIMFNPILFTRGSIHQGDCRFSDISTNPEVTSLGPD